MSQFLPDENKRKSMSRIQGMMGVFMGLMYIAIAIAIGYKLKNHQMPGGVFGMGETFSWVMVAVFVGYGVFRMFRAMKIIKSM